MSFHYPLYAIWADGAENGPLSGQCGYLSERGDEWVRDGKLQPRSTTLLYSPNFPKN